VSQPAVMLVDVATKTCFKCGECGVESPKWAGRCSQCSAWNSLVEELRSPAASVSGLGGVTAMPIGEVSGVGVDAVPTSIGELDRVLGGGLVAGSVSLIGGEPGIGKSTLVLQLAGVLAKSGLRVLYVTGEESTTQVRGRADRLGAIEPQLWLAACPDVTMIRSLVEEVEPHVLVIDSIQAVYVPGAAGVSGGAAQVRDCAQRLVELAKSRSMATLLVGQVTKDGELAGPKALEHVVDTVLSFEGDRHHTLRFLRAVKHRFGGTGELGLFEMSAAGLEEVRDPSALFLADRVAGVAGSVVVPVVEGGRPLLVEVQALVTRSTLPQPRRSAQGVDGGRASLLAAVLQRRALVDVSSHDVYVSAVGGVRISEPAADLAILLAMATARQGAPFPADTVACGEIGLVGEVRRVTDEQRRLSEAARLGFTRAIVPASTDEGPAGLELVRVQHVRDALDFARVPPSASEE
jgi:DNA repair protein RadA/Sms